MNEKVSSNFLKINIFVVGNRKAYYNLKFYQRCSLILDSPILQAQHARIN